MSAGAIAIDSSSGSDSSSSSESSSDEESPWAQERFEVQFSETTPDGFEFFKHKKSLILHSRKLGSDVFACKAKVSPNFQVLPRVIRFKYPKCLKCFPKDPHRIRNLEGLNTALEGALKRACLKK